MKQSQSLNNKIVVDCFENKKLRILLSANNLYLLSIKLSNKKSIATGEFAKPKTENTNRIIKKTKIYLRDYFEKNNLQKNFAEYDIPIFLNGFTDFQRRIFSELQNISFGEVISYAELGKKANSPKSSRAVGSCMAKNKFPIIIPCHRVIKANNVMGNFTGGKDLKVILLRHENHKLKHKNNSLEEQWIV